MTNVMNRGSRWAALALATLTAGHATAGTIEQFFYAEIAGSTVRDLTNSALFPTSPIIATPLHWQGTTLEGITNASVNYGSWLRGYLEPPMSGGYRFYVAAADSAELHLSTDHQPGNRRLIAGTTAPTERDSWTRFPSQTSPLIELEAGRQYYFEVRHKFGQAGQDYVRVGWQLPDGSAELPIPLARVQNFLSETSSGPGITNVAQLAPVIREPDLSRLRENRPVTITPEVDYAPPAIFQWFENGVPIPEANTSSLALGNLTTNDTGRTFTLVVDTATGSAMSADMVLQVLDDLVPPTLLAARTDGNPAGFTLYFSEPVDPATATDVANYTLSAGTIDRIEPRYGVEDSVYVVHMTLPGGVFTVTVNNVTDRSAAANVIAPGTTATVNLAAGFITAHYFGAINGGSPIVATTIENLILVTNRFPNHPDLIEELPEFGIPHNRADNYGVRVFGYLVPPVTGDYSFAIASDGQGLLYLSTDDSPANKRAIAVEPEWNGRRNYATPDRRSINRANSNGDLLIQTHFPGIGNDVQVNDSLNTVGAIPMVAGHRYYVEAIAAEAGGGDNLDVAWRLPGQTSIPFQGVIPGTHLSPIETGPDQAVEIVQQPADRSVPENRSIVFSVTHNGLAPFEYAWFRNGMPVVGANQRELTVFPTLADDQAVFTLRVRNRFSQDVTAPIKLTVIPDNTPPQILRAAADRHFDRVHLMFDERIRMDSASSPDQYHVTTEDGQTRLPVLGISFGPAEQGGVANVSLHTTGIQSGVRYRVATEGIRDTSAAGNATAIQQTVSFTGWVLTRGYVNYERFQDLPGDTIPDLTNAAKYPRNPDTAGYLTSWETPESVSDNFGSVISGMIIPPTSGFYQFYTASDRSSELWISTDASPANLMSVAADPMWASRREWTGNAGGRRQNNENVSQALQLVAGSFYRAELLHKASTGFDHAGATWRTPGGTAPINGSPSTLVGRSIAAWGNPDATTITITTQPADKVLPEGTSAQFTAAAGLETHFGPLFPTMNFQWYTNNVPVVGATQATYTTPNLGCLDDQMRVHCEIFVPGNTVATRQALITVIYGEPPQLVLVTGSDTLDRIVLQFDEPVAADTVNQLANYQISGLTITGAAHDPADPRRIILNTSAQTPGTRHSYDISGIADQSACRNLMSRTTGEFTAWQLTGGWVKHELYRISSGSALSLLTSHPKFPSAPDVVSYLEAIELPPTVEVNTGSRLSGFLQVTNSGSYHFAIASDDQSALYLSTDESPTNKRLLAAEPEWNNSRNWSSNERRVNSSGNTFFPSLKTVPINRTAFTVGAVTLQAGARYYFEVLHKQGGGGGHVAVTMYPSTSSLPADNSPAISGSQVSNFINPDNTITITKQPVSQFASHFASVQLRAELAAVGGIPSLQWFKNGVPIANARQTNLTVSASTLTTGDAFRLEARLPGATVSSDIARVWIVNGEPELQIERLPDARAVIRWPTSPGSELLESATALQPVIQWTIVPWHGEENGQRVFTNDPGSGRSIFRVRQP